MVMAVKAFKIHCKSLTIKKRKLLFNMCDEYAKVYNFASKFIPSMNGSKHLSHSNPSSLYTKWIKSGKISRQYIQSLDAFNAIKDAVTNFKVHGNMSVMTHGNIIKFEKNRYKVIKLNEHYGIQIGTRKNGIYLPIIIGKFDNLINLINDITKSHENPGQLLYNYKDNTISITYNIDEKFIPKYKKDEEIDTIIGVDLGSNNLAAIASISFDKNEIKSKIIELKKLGRKNISRNDVNIKINEIKVISGLNNQFRIKQLKKLERHRRRLRIKVGHKRKNIQSYNEHYISAKVIEIAKKHPCSMISLERNLTNVRTKYSLWNPGGIREKLRYKLENIGIRSKDINSYGTSKRCNKCGTYGIREKGTIYFSCPSCGLGGSIPSSTIGQYNADVNAAINIALMGLFSLYGKKEGSVANRPQIHPNEHTRETEPKVKNEVCDGTVKTASCKDMVPESNQLHFHENEFSETHWNNLTGKGLAMVSRQVDCVPEKGFSYPYKGKDNLSVRTKFEQKIDIGEVLSQSKF